MILNVPLDDIPEEVWWVGLKPQATTTGLKLTMPIKATGMKLGTLFTVPGKGYGMLGDHVAEAWSVGKKYKP